MRRLLSDVRVDVSSDVCISNVWGRNVFGTSVLGPSPDVRADVWSQTLDRMSAFRIYKKCDKKETNAYDELDEHGVYFRQKS